MMLHYPNGKGTLLKLLLQLFWRSPIFHLRQVYRNATRISFWQYGFRSHPAVRRRWLHFWSWWSLNRDMRNDADCPGWQFWYWEIRGLDFNTVGADGIMPDAKISKPKAVLLKNYRKFPMIKSAIERKYMDQGILKPFSPQE